MRQFGTFHPERRPLGRAIARDFERRAHLDPHVRLSHPELVARLSEVQFDRLLAWLAAVTDPL